MEKLTAAKVRELAEQALKNGESSMVKVTDADRKYLQVVLSNFNTKNKTKLSSKKTGDGNVIIQALYDYRPDVKSSIHVLPLFLELQAVIDNPAKQLTEDEFNNFKLRLDEVLSITKYRGLIPSEQLKSKRNNILG